MAEQDVRQLELRIKELENQLKQFQPQDLTAEDIKTYQKVSASIASTGDWGCGINECHPISICYSCRICYCRVCRVCRTCICHECTCGPCNVCIVGGSGGGGFSGFGG